MCRQIGRVPLASSHDFDPRENYHRRAAGCGMAAAARAALSNSWKFLVSTGKYDPWLEFYSGPMPRSPEDAATAQNKLLCRLKVDPLTLRVAQGNAINSGDLGWARLIGADGKAIMDCKMTLKGGGGVMEWNTLELRKGGPVTVFRSLNFYSGRDEKNEEDE
jgi:hypothetical protein